MPSAIKGDESRTIIIKTTLLLVAITLNALEYFLPRIPFLPWLKPGLANCVTIVWIIRYGGVDALFFTLLRIGLVGFYFGFSFITLALSLSGGLMATCAMGVAWHILGRRSFMGIIGMAILGAFFHNMGQLMAVFFLLAYNIYLFYQIPFMIYASIVFGTLVGLLAPMLAGVVNRSLELTGNSNISMPKDQTVPRSYSVISILVLLLSISLVFIDNRSMLVVLALTITLCVQIITGGSIKALLFPVRRFWLLFIFVACFYLFRPYGTRLPWASWLTYEGVQSAVAQWLRLWTWLEITFIFSHFRFHTFFFRTLNMFFRSYQSTLYAGILAVEDFPGVFDLIRKRITMEFRPMVIHPITTSKRVIQRAFDDVRGYVDNRHNEAISEEERP